MNSDKKQVLSENSDDDDLPEFFPDYVPNFEIKQNQIVWAPYHGKYWPAIVRSVKKKQRKACIWYLDTPRRCFTLSFCKIKDFYDSEFSTRVRKDFENTSMDTLHRKVYLNAITYIRRQAQGCDDDPSSFFDASKDNSGFGFKDIKCNNTVLSGENEECDAMEGVSNTNIFIASDSDEDASNTETPIIIDSDEESVSHKKTSMSDEEDSEIQNSIVKCIAAGCVDKHLLEVKSKKVSSKYLKFYEEAMKTSRKRLLEAPPILPHVGKNEKKLRLIGDYLTDYYEKVIEGDKDEMVNYISYVWLPEAIYKAVELINAGSFDPDKTIPESQKELFKTKKSLNTKVGKIARKKRKCRS